MGSRICDERKKSEGLGVDFPSLWRWLPAFHQRTLRRLAKLTGVTRDWRRVWRRRAGPGMMPGKPFVTDNGNYAWSIYFFREPRQDVWLMASQLDACPGLWSTGCSPPIKRWTIRWCSSGGGWGRWMAQLGGLGVFFFHVVVVSSTVGAAKPRD